MYAKLFSRITESSLMEEPLLVRYAFVMLLAVADPRGYVIGTDVALARRLNMPLSDFQAAVARLSAPDPNSNSPEEDGRRLLPSDGERGYRLVNYTKYSALRDEGHRRDYMRGYMAEYRAGGKGKSAACKQPVNSVNSSKQGKPQLAHVDVDVDVDANEEREGAGAPTRSKKSFASPSIEECKVYAGAISLPDSEAEAFFDHFQSNGWKVGGKAPMKDWQASMRTWKRRSGQSAPPAKGELSASAPRKKLSVLDSL